MDVLHHWWREYGPQTESAYFAAQTMVRLILAAFLGGMIGVEREIRRRPAGLRTNMFICFGAAFFTILSVRLAGQFTGDHTRIAAQIIPGIGFIGAGSILHERGSVTGLTTAATIFVVASIGMAAGGGLYAVALFSTVVILLSLTLFGVVEQRFNLKSVAMIYEVRGPNAEEMIAGINGILEDDHRIMQTVQIGHCGGHYRVQFTVDGTQREHSGLLTRLRQMPNAEYVENLGVSERE
jgi:putative Mg2+ transporter-C (MgtC) family protein